MLAAIVALWLLHDQSQAECLHVADTLFRPRGNAGAHDNGG